MKKLFNYLKDDFFHKFIFILLSLLLIFLFIKKDPFRFYFLPIYLLFYVFPFCNHIIDKFLGNDKKTYYSSYSGTYYPPSKKNKNTSYTSDTYSSRRKVESYGIYEIIDNPITPEEKEHNERAYQYQHYSYELIQKQLNDNDN